jgi:murein DD-endopeptidase MepM/ murein hydrolase activator NlpD
MKLSLLISLVFVFNLYAANISRLKDELNSRSFKVTKLAATINSLDKSIGSNNRKYLDKRNQLNQLEAQLAGLQEELTSSADNVSKDYDLVNKIFRQYLLDRIDQEDDNKILKDKIYIQTLSLQLEELNHAQLESKKMLDQVNTLTKTLSGIKREEQSIYDLIVELENDKKNKSQEYLNNLESKNTIRERLEKAMAKSRISKKRKKISKSKSYRVSNFKKKNLRLPLDGFNSFKGGKKGVTFTFDKVSPVLASSSGHVAYSGELASYGKIIMIDHGSDIRSLVLGDIKINVKKGDFVNKGQVLAYTISEPGLTKNLYYELRKKNIAQNTLQILKDNKVL